ncbi:hypothetical protein BIW11_08346 [Tropilaelaps mercedesae]|uniref:Uncharacterized protein n=1 Tax=Tropilaelaps mercedesae TaxID=418985 RepID=A0A1V9XPX0_9ACAR|nr:hypothetical protein BIW11_08346 [Tropilaelaps mercedesae]
MPKTTLSGCHVTEYRSTSQTSILVLAQCFLPTGLNQVENRSSAFVETARSKQTSQCRSYPRRHRRHPYFTVASDQQQLVNASLNHMRACLDQQQDPLEGTCQHPDQAWRSPISQQFVRRV